jgi:hypothetical protein
MMYVVRADLKNIRTGGFRKRVYLCAAKTYDIAHARLRGAQRVHRQGHWRIIETWITRGDVLDLESINTTF